MYVLGWYVGPKLMSKFILNSKCSYPTSNNKITIVKSLLHIYPCSLIKGDTNLKLVGNNIDVVTNIS